MSNSCSHDCSTCSQKCEKADLIEQLNPLSRVTKVIGVVSGKGGVGKSLVTGLMAAEMRRRGREVAILDADITGPSIPKMFGYTEKAFGDERGILPGITAGGIRLISVNMLLDNDTDPVVWRGSLISGTVKQFWTDVVWGDIDWMFVDMPPGTGDVPLTVFQSLPLDGVLIVLSPQELVGMIVEKAVNMASMMNVPVLGLIENMSWMACPHCGERIYPFGQSRSLQVAEAHALPLLAQLPIDPALASACDLGRAETAGAGLLAGAADVLQAVLDKKA